MRTIAVLVAVLLAMPLLTACGAGGSGSSVTGIVSPSPLDPSCKAINSVWTSTTDLERHDLTNVLHNVTKVDYEYRASDGSYCSYVSNPSQTIDALLTTPADYGLSNQYWDYRLAMTFSLAIGGVCGTYAATASDPNQVAYIKMSCNSIQICQTSNGAGLFNCKTFN